MKRRSLKNVGKLPIQDVVRHIEKGYRMEPPEGCPMEISRLMNDAWILEPSVRPSFTIILQRLKLIYANLYSNSGPKRQIKMNLTTNLTNL
uniref:Pkinase_Tyr domain-containing protein n=1 Tax=Onchocerca flexuosa TaxID=387005 RepID=A0A183HCS5_9BILA